MFLCAAVFGKNALTKSFSSSLRVKLPRVLHERDPGPELLKKFNAFKHSKISFLSEINSYMSSYGLRNLCLTQLLNSENYPFENPPVKLFPTSLYGLYWK